MTAQHQADLERLDELFKSAKSEHDAFEALKRKAAATVFRCGEHLAEAQVIAKKYRLGWYSKLEEYKIAEATARQAIELYRNATAAGYTAEDLENLPITEAKTEFRVIGKRRKAEEEPKPRADEEPDGKAEPEANPDEEPNAGEEQERNSKEGRDQQATTAAPPADGHGKGEARTQEEQEWGVISLSDLLQERRRFLQEEALKAWNERRKTPFDDEYLLFLFDLGVLSIRRGEVRYLPDQEDDREELVAVLGDHLAPILEQWTTPDDLQAALKELVFAGEAEEDKAPRVEEGKARPKQAQSAKGGLRS